MGQIDAQNHVLMKNHNLWITNIGLPILFQAILATIQGEKKTDCLSAYLD